MQEECTWETFLCSTNSNYMEPKGAEERFEQTREKVAQLCLEFKQEEACELWNDFLNSVVFKTNWEVLKTYAEACIEQLPDYHVGYFVDGMALKFMGDLESALNRFSEVIAFCPGHTLALHHKSETLGMMEKYPEALECAEELLGYDPHNPEYLRLSSGILLRMHRYDEARVQIEEALTLLPGDTTLMVDRGICIGLSGNLEGAMKQFARVEKILKGNIMSTSGMNTLALVYLNRAEARKQLKDHEGGELELALGFTLMELSKANAFEHRSN